jgi:ribosome maturation factor RimP
MEGDLLERIVGLVEPIVVDEGMELVDLQFRRENRGWVLRVLLDKEDGVNVADCTKASRQVSTVLDVKDLIDRPYFLEVSSPGLDRPLKKEADFQRFKGRKASIEIDRSIDGQRRFSGKLLGIESGIITIMAERGNTQVPFSWIKKAKLCYEFPSTR